MPNALIISCFDWYKKRLEPIREIFMAHGYDVTVLESDFDHLSKSLIKKQYNECTYIHVPKYRNNISISRIWSHLVFAQKVKKHINKSQPDIIHIQIPPNKTAKYCAEYKKKNPKTKMYLDIVDLWPESMPLGKLKEAHILKRWIAWRNDGIVFADHIYTECELYQKKLCLDPEKTSVLYLFKDQTNEERVLIEKLLPNNIAQKNEKAIKFAYLGSMNNIIDISGICKVIHKFIQNGYKCELHAIGDGENKELFCKEVTGTGCKAIFYGPIYDEMEKIRILTPCDYAINMMKDVVSVGLTMKSIDYLSYGLPLINNIDGDTNFIIEKEELGINCEKLQLPIKIFDHRQILAKYDRLFSRNQFIKTITEVIE